MTPAASFLQRVDDIAIDRITQPISDRISHLFNISRYAQIRGTVHGQAVTLMAAIACLLLTRINVMNLVWIAMIAFNFVSLLRELDHYRGEEPYSTSMPAERLTGFGQRILMLGLILVCAATFPSETDRLSAVAIDTNIVFVYVATCLKACRPNPPKVQKQSAAQGLNWA